MVARNGILARSRNPLKRSIEVSEPREVTEEEVRTMEPGPVPVIAKIRDHHHRLARMAAMGMTPREIAHFEAMSPAYAKVIYEDPAFRELVEHYRAIPSSELASTSYGILATIQENLATALRIEQRQLRDAEDGGEKVPLQTLSRVIGDLADRAGFGKRLSVTVDQSFAGKLDRAIERSGTKLIEAQVLPAGFETTDSAVGFETTDDGAMPAGSVEATIEVEAIPVELREVEASPEQSKATEVRREPIPLTRCDPPVGGGDGAEGLMVHPRPQRDEWERVRRI